jgi:hypothetical protein
MGGVTLVTAGSGRTLDADDLGLAEELARRIMVAVEHAQLYHDALQATRARDEILGVVAHDLRNPLSTIRMAAQLMADDVAPAHRKPMDMMLRTTERMNQLIQDLLEVTRMESGKLALDLSTESPGAVLREASAMMAPLAAARSITFEAQIADDLPRIPLDSSRVLQVISNWWATPSSSRPRGGASRSAPSSSPASCASPWPTPAPASPRTRSPASSGASGRRARRTAAASAWASPSRAASWRPTAGASGWRASKGEGATVLLHPPGEPGAVNRASHRGGEGTARTAGEFLCVL